MVTTCTVDLDEQRFSYDHLVRHVDNWVTNLMNHHGEIAP